MRDFSLVYVAVGCRLGHSAMSAQRPVLAQVQLTAYQADRPRFARDIRGRIGLALDCRSGPGPRTARCRARSSSDQGAARLNRHLFGSRQSALTGLRLDLHQDACAD
jgi:hypothetical protein